MKNQIFKTIIQPEVLWNFIKENGEEMEDHYIFNKSLYNSGFLKSFETFPTSGFKSMQKYTNFAFVKLLANAEKKPFKTGGTVVAIIISYFFNSIRELLNKHLPR